MSLFHILRNLAVLVILTVGGLGFTPPPDPELLCVCSFPRYKCSNRTTGCHHCGGSTRCCYVACYDTLYHRCCGL